MLFFRSEEKLHDWLKSHKTDRGEIFTISRLWEFSQRWYHNRMSPDYHGRTIEQVQEIFNEFGLISRFWQII